MEIFSVFENISSSILFMSIAYNNHNVTGRETSSSILQHYKKYMKLHQPTYILDSGYLVSQTSLAVTRQSSLISHTYVLLYKDYLHLHMHTMNTHSIKMMRYVQTSPVRDNIFRKTICLHSCLTYKTLTHISYLAAAS